jgi:hypothetical protein
VIYVYAITEPAVSPPDGSGLAGAPLELISEAGLQGVYSTHGSLDPEPEPESLWTHELVIEQLMKTGAVLPLRFGTTLRDTYELREILARDRQTFSDSLLRVRDCVELAVRIRLPGGQPRRADNGRAYLDARLATQRRHDSIAQRTLAPLSEMATATARHRDGADAELIRASFLVPRERIERFIDAVGRLQAHEPELTLSCTGPWAPYSFVEAAP